MINLTHLLLLFLLLNLISFTASATNTTTAYDLLTSYGLPSGLLPRGVKDFAFDASTGSFEVRLDRACNAALVSESAVHYDPDVSGTIAYGRIGGLSGISAKDLFLWFPVRGIRVDVPSSGLIYFDVGVVRKQFPVSLFETPPSASRPPSRTNWGVNLFRVFDVM
ncbi:hypothetical protein QJS10_CPB18g00464 [Acorus calamus]|uniref:Uncharacterized protein n=1 Tax=Acorus calamus TaxID=4465 RepID=A0AAV9CL04_ACOCL|nr:hypothetical protein QJS10_CPB18g00464 [Acorus calamus]